MLDVPVLSGTVLHSAEMLPDDIPQEALKLVRYISDSKGF